MRPLVAAACLLFSSSCGSEMLRTGRGPVLLVLESLQGSEGGGGNFANPLLSDVTRLVDAEVNGVTVQVPTIFNDVGLAVIRAELKDQLSTALPTPLNAVTITRYRVTYRRSDGRNAPGVDVPFGFDGAVTATIQPGSSADVIFDLVRHASKSEPPLSNLSGGGGLRFISTVAEVTFFGRDQNGNEVMVTGMMDVVFGDFADEE
jgi:hypothetical protein